MNRKLVIKKSPVILDDRDVLEPSYQKRVARARALQLRQKNTVTSRRYVSAGHPQLVPA